MAWMAVLQAPNLEDLHNAWLALLLVPGTLVSHRQHGGGLVLFANAWMCPRVEGAVSGGVERHPVLGPRGTGLLLVSSLDGWRACEYEVVKPWVAALLGTLPDQTESGHRIILQASAVEPIGRIAANHACMNMVCPCSAEAGHGG